MLTIVPSRNLNSAFVHTPVCKESPRAPVRLVRDSGCWFWEVVRCPYCENKHRHSAGGNGGEHALQFLGGRMAHCNPEFFVDRNRIQHLPLWNGDAEYRLIAIEGRPSKAELDRHFPVVSGDWAALHISNWQFQDIPAESAYSHRKQRPVSRQTFTQDQRAAVWAKTSGRCFYCGVLTNPFLNFSIDHFDARSRGGTNELENLVPCCKTCNSSKGALDLDDWRYRQGGGLFWFERMNGWMEAIGEHR